MTPRNTPTVCSWGFLGTMSEAELHWLRSRLLGGKLEEGPRRPAPVPAAHGAGLRSGGPDRLRSRRAGPARDPAGLRPVRAVGIGPGGRPALRRPSPPLPHPALGRRPRRSTGLGAAEPWPCPGHPAQPGVRGRLCLWPHQDPHAVPARRGAEDQGADPPGPARGLAVPDPRAPSRLHHLGAVPAEPAAA